MYKINYNRFALILKNNICTYTFGFRTIYFSALFITNAGAARSSLSLSEIKKKKDVCTFISTILMCQENIAKHSPVCILTINYVIRGRFHKFMCVIV